MFSHKLIFCIKKAKKYSVDYFYSTQEKKAVFVGKTWHSFSPLLAIMTFSFLEKASSRKIQGKLQSQYLDSLFSEKFSLFVK